jgi:biotin carboxyl carrier protein
LLTKPPGGNPADPWHTIGAWRLSASGGAPLRLEEGDDHHVAVVRLQGGRLTVTVGGALHEVSEVAEQGPDVRLKVDGHPLVARLTRSGDDVWAQIAGRTHRMRLQRATHHADASAISGAGTLTAPMSGAVIDIRVSPGDHVVSGQVLMVVEAMKMEHPVVSPGDGVVTAVHVTVGNVVKGDMPLLDWEPADNATPDEGASP